MHVVAVAQVEEYAGKGETNRETEPNAMNAQTCFEAEAVGAGNCHQKVTDKCAVHDGLHVLYASEHAGIAELQTVAKLVGEEQDEQRHRNRSHLCRIGENAGGRESEYVEQRGKRGRYGQHHQETLLGVFSHAIEVLFAVGVAHENGNGKRKSLKQQEE